MERLSDIYRLYCEKSTDNSKNGKEFEWIPGKILKCLYDKDFRWEIYTFFCRNRYYVFWEEHIKIILLSFLKCVQARNSGTHYD